MNRPFARLALVAASLAGCASTPPPLETSTTREVYDEMVRERQQPEAVRGLTEAGRDRSTARAEEIARRAEEGAIVSAEDHFFAAAILVRSNELEHLALAESLGRRAGVLGEPRGRTVAAEAVDRQALLLDEPQRYGTQYVYDPVFRRWALHPLDGLATDEDRRAVGLPPLAWFEERIQALNQPEALDQADERIRRAVR